MTEERVKLRIIHTNDIHSHFDQMPRIQRIISNLKKEAGEENSLILDIGDHLDRVRPETEGTEGLANIAVLNATGYDAVTIGNNEGLTFTPEVLEHLYGKAAVFPVVLGNMLEASTGQPPAWAQPFYRLEKAGVKIGLIGVTAPFSDFYRLLGWNVTDPFEAVRRAVQELRSQVDLIVVMSHLGIRSDERMAEQIPGIHVILGGHTHHLLTEPLRMGEAWVCAAGKFGQYVGSLDLEFYRENGRLELVGAGVYPTDDWDADVPMQTLIEGFTEEAEQTLGRELVHLDRELAFNWYGESSLGNLLAAGLRKWVGAEIGLVNAGQLLGGTPQGSISAGLLLKLCPSPINPCRLRLTGAQIKQALEESLLPEFMDKPIYGFGFRGKVLGTLCVDGLHIEYDPDAEPYSRITDIRVGEAALALERSYTVGTIDMFTFGIGYLSIAQGVEPAFYLPEFLRDVLLHELRDPEALAGTVERRWNKLH